MFHTTICITIDITMATTIRITTRTIMGKKKEREII
jgi:hypothetical protein